MSQHHSLERRKLSLSVAYLVVLIPGQALRSEDEPVSLGASFHDADVADGQPPLADHLQESTVRRDA